ncbi:hypothetical protein SC08_Contig95orf00679 [Clostridium butyricum]|nr:hypothetical protein SC08_Contig95orf00679 [Clostridium butyricum]
MIIRKYRKNMNFQNCKEIDKYFSYKHKFISCERICISLFIKYISY